MTGTDSIARARGTQRAGVALLSTSGAACAGSLTRKSKRTRLPEATLLTFRASTPHIARNRSLVLVESLSARCGDGRCGAGATARGGAVAPLASAGYASSRATPASVPASPFGAILEDLFTAILPSGGSGAPWRSMASRARRARTLSTPDRRGGLHAGRLRLGRLRVLPGVPGVRGLLPRGGGLRRVPFGRAGRRRG